MQKENLVGSKFGRLTVVSLGVKARRWLCRCECGGEKEVYGPDLKRGATQSCGCLRKEVVADSRSTHGMSKTPTYGTWLNMRRRCTDTGNQDFTGYGGRGIRVCERWDTSFENFLVDMGECPPGYSIERRDFNGDYSPENCLWIPKGEQARNTRKNVYFEGKTLAEWARTLGRDQATISWRLKKFGTVHLPDGHVSTKRATYRKGGVT